MSDRLQELSTKMRAHATNLISWYTAPPMASEVLEMLDLFDDALSGRARPTEQETPNE